MTQYFHFTLEHAEFNEEAFKDFASRLPEVKRIITLPLTTLLSEIQEMHIEFEEGTVVCLWIK